MAASALARSVEYWACPRRLGCRAHPHPGSSASCLRQGLPHIESRKTMRRRPDKGQRSPRTNRSRIRTMRNSQTSLKISNCFILKKSQKSKNIDLLQVNSKILVFCEVKKLKLTFGGHSNQFSFKLQVLKNFLNPKGKKITFRPFFTQVNLLPSAKKFKLYNLACS